MIKLKHLIETIKASEAYHDRDAVQSVMDGKRDLGWITIKSSPDFEPKEFWEAIKYGSLKTLKVPSNPYEAYIYYRPGAEAKAKELRDIAEKYEGYLAWDATEEDSRRIGELLGYRKSDIDAYIRKNYR